MTTRLSFSETHKLKCLDADLDHGARLPRNWGCACGERFFGFDNKVIAAHRAHKKEIKAKG